MAVATRWRFSKFRRWLGAAAVAATFLPGCGQPPDVETAALESGQGVTVLNEAEVLAFLPATANRQTALIFICGSGADAGAYAVLLRPVAQAGYPVFVVRLPYIRAFLHVQQPLVFERVQRVIATHPDIARWVLSGHSLGAALSVLFAQADPRVISGLVLIATDYPTDVDLSGLPIPVTRIHATHDGLVTPAKLRASRRLLPPQTRSIEVEGGNHAQFGRYHDQGFDGVATISREDQEALTRAEIIRLLAEVDSRR